MNSSEELEGWLEAQPPEVSVALAARAALRVLPLLQEVVSTVGRTDVPQQILLAVFRATAVSWAAAAYKAHAPSLASAARAAGAFAETGAASGVRAAPFVARAAVCACDATLAALSGGQAPRGAGLATASAVRALTTAGFFGTGIGDSVYTSDATIAVADKSAFWFAVSNDTTSVEHGATATVIAGSPLSPWPYGQPGQLKKLWQELKSALLAAGQDWEVWISWYDDRLDGRVWDEERELAYVRIDNDLWDQGPAIVNGEIKRRINEHRPPEPVPPEPSPEPGLSLLDGVSVPGRSPMREPKPPPVPEIPPQRPAALEPDWSNGILVLPSNLAETYGDPEALAPALKVLRQEIAELADDADGEANIDKRPIAYLRRNAERIPDHAPTQVELFRLAHVKEFLEGYSKTVNDEWPDFLAQRLHALTLHFDRTVRQFPKWRAFVRNAEKDRLTSERAAEVPAIAEVTVELLRDEDAQEFADAAIPNALESLNAPLATAIAGDGQPLDPIEARHSLLAEDVLESVNNILKATAEGLLVCATPGKAAAKAIGSTAKETAAGFASEARKSIVEEGKRLGKGTGPALTKWGKRMLFGGSAVAGAAAPSLARLLVHAFPEKFGWLQPVMDFFSSVIR
jgi:hypothetical protein